MSKHQLGGWPISIVSIATDKISDMLKSATRTLTRKRTLRCFWTHPWLCFWPTCIHWEVNYQCVLDQLVSIGKLIDNFQEAAHVLKWWNLTLDGEDGIDVVVLFRSAILVSSVLLVRRVERTTFPTFSSNFTFKPTLWVPRCCWCF